MTHEEVVKAKLYDLWLKEAKRVQPKGWTRMRVSLGLGIVKKQGLTKIDKILDTIEDFGIDLAKLDAMEAGYDELFDVYTAIQSYRGSVRFLKELKNHMGTFKSFKGWGVNGNTS